MAFTQKLMNVTFVLGQGQFGDGAGNQVQISGVRMSAKISRAGGPAMSQGSFEIYGMTLSDMNQLSTLGLVATTWRRNSIAVEAGDAEGLQIVFSGTITDAYPDFSGIPDVPFRVEAHTGFIEAIAPILPKNYSTPTSAALMMANIAALWNNGQGVPFENNGVSVILPQTYLYGSLRNQALDIVKAAGIEWNGVEDGTLAIWNPGSSRNGTVPLISPDTGMVGYPSFYSNGILLRTIYNPAIGFGKNIAVQSSLGNVLAGSQNRNQPESTISFPNVSPNAITTFWNVCDLKHDLSTLMPNGPWFSDLKAKPIGLGPVVPSL